MVQMATDLQPRRLAFCSLDISWLSQCWAWYRAPKSFSGKDSVPSPHFLRAFHKLHFYSNTKNTVKHLEDRSPFLCHQILFHTVILLPTHSFAEDIYKYIIPFIHFDVNSFFQTELGYINVLVWKVKKTENCSAWYIHSFIVIPVSYPMDVRIIIE